MDLSCSTRVIACWMLSVVLGFAGSGQAEDDLRTFADLKREHEPAYAAIKKRSALAKTDSERKAVQEEIWRAVKKAAGAAFAWAEAHPDDPESIDAIVWTVHGLANGYYPEYDAEMTRAYQLLTERAIDSEKVVPVCYYADYAGYGCPAAKRFLETALEKSTSRLVRGAACLGLARSYRGLAEFIRFSKDPSSRKLLEELNGAGVVAKFEDGNPEENDRRAETYFERVMDEFGDLKMPAPYNETPFGGLARGELYALRHLSVGGRLPDFEGEGVGGRKLRLEDYRGKVVVIVFWASWCGPCMEMIPHERKLVKRLKDRPFVLLGVNGDDDRVKAAEVMKKEAMTWPSLWNGGATGGIVEQLGVQTWPTIYVVDAQGVIRYKNEHGAALDKAVDQLLKEAASPEK